MLYASVVALLAMAVSSASASTMIPDLRKPNVNVGTDYYIFYNATSGKNYTAFEVYRTNQVLAWGLKGDNGASPGGDIGFLTQQYGQSTGYILRYCVQMELPNGVGQAELQAGGSSVFQSYECCNGGMCSNCGYTGSGTNPNSQMVGRSYGLDIPPFANGVMSAQYGWWYSFNNAGYCEPTQALGTNGCTYRASPYVDVVRYQDINSRVGWTNSPQNYAEYQIINNMFVNAFSTDLMTSYIYDPVLNKYTQTKGRLHADPAQQCQVSCPMGTFSATGRLDAFNPNGNCAACPAGTYQDQLGSTSCKPCPSGLTTNGPGSVSVAACYSPSTPVCAPGTYNQYTGHAPCTPCPTGTYQTAHSAQTCLSCPAFTTSTVAGAASASSCVLNPPQAVSLFSYTDATTAGPIANTILADQNGEVAYLQNSNYGQTVATSGTVSLRCIEAVDMPFFNNQYNCWGQYCGTSFSTNTLNLPINGTSGNWVAPGQWVGGQWVQPSNGRWYEFPAAGECTTSQLPGQGGCTWKASTIVLQASLGALINQSDFYSCVAQNTFGYCWNQMTTAQWQNSTQALGNFTKYATLASTVSASSSTILGPVTVQNGRCVVQCPSGYTFRSAFTAPYCVPSTTISSLLASNSGEEDAEAINTAGNNAAAVIGGSIASVAVVAMAAAIVAYRLKRRQALF